MPDHHKPQLTKTLTNGKTIIEKLSKIYQPDDLKTRTDVNQNEKLTKATAKKKLTNP